MKLQKNLYVTNISNTTTKDIARTNIKIPKQTYMLLCYKHFHKFLPWPSLFLTMLPILSVIEYTDSDEYSCNLDNICLSKWLNSPLLHSCCTLSTKEHVSMHVLHILQLDSAYRVTYSFVYFTYCNIVCYTTSVTGKVSTNRHCIPFNLLGLQHWYTNINYY